jgi:hypothetical protein
VSTKEGKTGKGKTSKDGKKAKKKRDVGCD